MYRAQREHETNIVDPDHQYNCIKSLIIRYEEVFGQDKIRLGQFFCSNSITENIYCLVSMRNRELNRDQNLIGGQMAVQN